MTHKKNHNNTDEERLAAQRIFGILPDEQAKELIAIWEEFEVGETAETKICQSNGPIGTSAAKYF